MFVRPGEWSVVTSRCGYSCRKGGDTGWLVASRKAEVGRQAGVGRWSEAGGYAPLPRSPPSAPPSAPSGGPLLPRRNVAGAPSGRSYTKSFTKRSGDRGYPSKIRRHQHRGSAPSRGPHELTSGFTRAPLGRPAPPEPGSGRASPQSPKRFPSRSYRPRHGPCCPSLSVRRPSPRPKRQSPSAPFLP